MNKIIESPLFGIVLTIIGFSLGLILKRKYNYAIFFPALIGIIFVISILSLFNINLNVYNNGGKFISFFLGPVTIMLAYPLYNQLFYLKKYFFVIFLGIFFSSFMSIISVFLLSKIFILDKKMILSLITKSVTTPIAIEISKTINSNLSITIIATLITGLFGAIFSEKILNLFNIENKIVKGISIGSSFHGFGTAKALEIGELEGALSGLAIGITGLITTIILPFIIMFLF